VSVLPTQLVFYEEEWSPGSFPENFFPTGQILDSIDDKFPIGEEDDPSAGRSTKAEGGEEG
jgi:hypothetical protein